MPVFTQRDGVVVSANAFDIHRLTQCEPQPFSLADGVVDDTRMFPENLSVYVKKIPGWI